MVNDINQKLDVLAIGAHPDDVELGCGALLAKLAAEGRKVGILDLTRGELGSRGDAEQRLREAAKAGEILGIALRMNAGLPDGGLANTLEQQRAVIPFIRATRPGTILALMTPDRHPDHGVAHDLSRDANFYAGLTRIETGREAYRAPRLYYFHPYVEYAGMPSCIVDVSDTFALKLDALRAYASQFHNPSYPGPDTFIATREFWEGIETRGRYWGNRIGVSYGEPLYVEGPLPLDSLPTA
ncbi:MAG: bacillithiol biosynthesis deacetylase BshB1 [Candidatus Hydrogenedentes bacterium]|nr:bacillithiol biosynthesis deacetylase BshB1 [Candidatus Hydrogenedentota bacterium]